MPRLRVKMPPALDQWIDHRVAEGRYVGAREYICDLIRRDEVAARLVRDSNYSIQNDVTFTLPSQNSSC